MKSDLKYTISQMLYGCNIRLPGVFFAREKNSLSLSEFSDYMSAMDRFFSQFQAQETRANQLFRSYVPDRLDDCKYVFVRSHESKVGLRAFYHGPYLVLARSDKAFTLNIQGKERFVTVDRIKPALVEESEMVDNATPPIVHPEIKAIASDIAEIDNDVPKDVAEQLQNDVESKLTESTDVSSVNLRPKRRIKLPSHLKDFVVDVNGSTSDCNE